MANSHFQVSDAAPLSPQVMQHSKKVWVNLLPNIDLGHILTMISFVAALVTQWNVMDRRLTIIEQRAAQSESQSTELKNDLKEIKAIMTQIQIQQAIQGNTVSRGNK